MANPAHMWIYDEAGQLMLGDSHVAGREGSIEVLSFHHHLYIPTDKDTGVTMGTRKHEPLIVLTQLNPVSPEFFKACASGKTLSSVQIGWYHVTDLGDEKEYYRHTLEQVKVVAVKPMMHYVKDPLHDQSGHLEEIHFRYQKIRVEYLAGNIVAEDSWRMRGART